MAIAPSRTAPRAAATSSAPFVVAARPTLRPAAPPRSRGAVAEPPAAARTAPPHRDDGGWEQGVTVAVRGAGASEDGASDDGALHAAVVGLLARHGLRLAVLNAAGRTARGG
ncbi:hypothetical protein AB5I41_22770 [Sphingomonas sp. MMS24-JH45]